MDDPPSLHRVKLTVLKYILPYPHTCFKDLLNIKELSYPNIFVFQKYPYI